MSEYDTDSDTDPNPSYQLRLLNMSPDVGGISLYVGDNPTPDFIEVEYPYGTTFATYPLNTVEVAIYAQGDGPGVGTSLFDSSLLVQNQRSYTLVLQGERISGNLALNQFEDDLSTPPIGAGRFRFVNTATHIGPVHTDISGTQLDTDLAVGSAGEYALAIASTHVFGVDTNRDGTPDATFTGVLVDGLSYSAYLLPEGKDGAPIGSLVVSSPTDFTTINGD